MTEQDVRADLARYNLPPLVIEGLVNYMVHHIPTGHFLTAVLENDLAGAFRRADSDSARALRDIVRYLVNDAPAVAWGSPQNFARWVANRE